LRNQSEHPDPLVPAIPSTRSPRSRSRCRSFRISIMGGQISAGKLDRSGDQPRLPVSDCTLFCRTWGICDGRPGHHGIIGEQPPLPREVDWFARQEDRIHLLLRRHFCQSKCARDEPKSAVDIKSNLLPKIPSAGVKRNTGLSVCVTLGPGRSPRSQKVDRDYTRYLGAPTRRRVTIPLKILFGTPGLSQEAGAGSQCQTPTSNLATTAWGCITRVRHPTHGVIRNCLSSIGNSHKSRTCHEVYQLLLPVSACPSSARPSTAPEQGGDLFGPESSSLPTVSPHYTPLRHTNVLRDTRISDYNTDRATRTEPPPTRIDSSWKLPATEGVSP